MAEWNVWRDISCIEEFADLYKWPGVYKIRLTDSSGCPIKIGRFLGNDSDGLLAIGESGTRTVSTRIKEFLKAYEGGKLKHSEAERLFLIGCTTRFRRGVYDNCTLQFAAKKLKDKAEAQIQEERLLKSYFVKYGELPPLNSDMPDKYIDWITFEPRKQKSYERNQ